MKTKYILTIKNKSQPEWLVWLLIGFPFLLGTLNGLLKLPWAIRYLMDAAWLALLFFMQRRNQSKGKKKIKILTAWIVLFLLYTGFVYVVQFQSPLYYLWGARNNFRFYVAFFACCAFLDWQDINDFFRITDRLFWLNAAVSLYQFLVMKVSGDYLGGIFGTEVGGNGYTNLFFVITVTKDVLFYLDKKESAGKCFSKCIAALLIAAIAEIKFFFVEFILIIVLAVMFSRFTWRKLWILLGGIAAALGGAVLLAEIFPEFAGFMSFEYLWEAATSDKGYTSSGDLNRLNAIPQINDLWLNNWGERLFGLGLGNCDTSGFDFLNTPFYKAYSYMHYTWRSYAMMYLECGWVGLMFYFGFFVLVYFQIRKIEKRSCGEAVTYCRLGRIMALMCMLVAVYNGSLRTEAGYMAYFVLAVPFIYQKAQNHNGVAYGRK